MNHTNKLPLEGVVVIDLGQVYQGPYAGFLMAQAGATVIKVEPPNGEPVRHRARISKGNAVPFAMLNANKRNISLNLKSPEGVTVLKELAAKADVLIENYAPGVLDRLGVGYSVLSAINPRLIYGSATGYGLSGPNRDNLAMDLTVQAASGIMSVTGFADGPPVKAGPAITKSRWSRPSIRRWPRIWQMCSTARRLRPARATVMVGSRRRHTMSIRHPTGMSPLSVSTNLIGSDWRARWGGRNWPKIRV